MSRIDRIRHTIPSRPASRTEADRGESHSATTVGLPVPVSAVSTVRSFRDERRPSDAEVAAQVLGQHGERRGLRAGPAYAGSAHAAYNQVEWSGRYDRRARKGRQTNTDI